jgi:NAD(P)-dependent dehydrogenase (short-subunit alcohol dehydrogenase family)
MDGVAIITGASRCIGREVARELALRGYAVVIDYAHVQRDADAAVDEILAAGGVAVSIRADTADEVDVDRLFAETIEAFGGVDIVVHAAPPARVWVDAAAARHLRGTGAVVDARARGGGPMDPTGAVTREPDGIT